MRQYQFAYQDDVVVPVAIDAPMPEPGRDEVRVLVEAASLNYRDLIVLDQAADGSNLGRVPLSDAAGRIDALGPDVEGWQVGERVAIGFFRDWIDGPFRSRYMPSAFGGRTTDGLLSEYVVVPATVLVRTPGGFSAEQAATLTEEESLDLRVFTQALGNGNGNDEECEPDRHRPQGADPAGAHTDTWHDALLRRKPVAQ